MIITSEENWHRYMTFILRRFDDICQKPMGMFVFLTFAMSYH